MSSSDVGFLLLIRYRPVPHIEAVGTLGVRVWHVMLFSDVSGNECGKRTECVVLDECANERHLGMVDFKTRGSVGIVAVLWRGVACD